MRAGLEARRDRGVCGGVRLCEPDRLARGGLGGSQRCLGRRRRALLGGRGRRGLLLAAAGGHGEHREGYERLEFHGSLLRFVNGPAQPPDPAYRNPCK